jgi:peptidoglycan/xylan/chitin deacetylase (PgdA/CDA1 family)
LVWSGLDGLVRALSGSTGIVFMLHSVTRDADDSPVDDPLRCPVSKLEMVLSWAKGKGFDLVSLDEALRRSERPGARRFMAFTFDDGLQDNIDVALPVMERYQAPLTLYVSTGFITREVYAWWLALEPILRAHDSIDVEAMGQRFAVADRKSKTHAMKAIRRWVHVDGRRAQMLRPTFDRYGVDIPALIDALAINRAQLERIGRHHLVTIGGHTQSHPFLPVLSADEVEREVTANKHYLESLLGVGISHFAYPHGAAGPREARIVEKAGFRTAVGTSGGPIKAGLVAGAKMYQLPREPLAPSDSLACVRCRESGIFHALGRLRAPAAPLKRGSRKHAIG